MARKIELYGCREGNLQGIDVKIPYNKITVITGVSGSGKSSLAFKTIFAEGRRRILESLDTKELYFLSQVYAPKIDLALGLPPAIAIRQSQYIRSPKSTVGTISHINSFLYILFSTCGDIPCNNCLHRFNKTVYNPSYKKECEKCKAVLPRLQPGAFSNQSPIGMCSKCGGEGVLQYVDETYIYPNQSLSIAEGGLAYGGPKPGTIKWNFFQNFLKQFGVDLYTPIKNFPQEAKRALLYGIKKSRKYKIDFPGIIPEIEKILKNTKDEKVRKKLESFVVKKICPVCKGSGINPFAASIRIGSYTIVDFLNMDINTLITELESLKFNDVRDKISAMPRKKILEIGYIMKKLGISYLTLSRKTASLSGGEMHRVLMASHLATQISGVVYVLDEPSTGLHAMEISNLIKVIKQLRDIGGGNTIIVVEHEKEIIANADYLIELGPGPSRLGGRKIYEGKPKDIKPNSNLVTAEVLYADSTYIKRKRRQISDKKLGIRGASSNNLKNINVDIPLHVLVCITGVSGSGKSSLVFDSLYAYAQKGRNISRTREKKACTLIGRELIDKIILSHQAPISRSSRSIVATYINVFTHIRDIFARTKDAKRLKLNSSHFSFNTKSGACSTCKGFGFIVPDNVNLLSGVEVVCPECGGKRFNEKVLSVKYKGYSIADVLDMDVVEAINLFSDNLTIRDKLEKLQAVGLGYLLLGQSTADLSGGEAQRLKLAVDLMVKTHKSNLYVFDEPTAGLHLKDIQKLVQLFDNLLDSGHSVIIIEHDLHLIWASDYIIEMGPGAGEAGGYIIAQGTPTEIAQIDTPTGKALAKFIKK